MKFTPEELDHKTEALRQAGSMVYKQQEFLETEQVCVLTRNGEQDHSQIIISQGNAVAKEPIFSLIPLESNSPPAPFPSTATENGSNGHTNGTDNDGATPSKPQPLAGIKVLDLSRVIAGPVISRTLAEHGAQVLKITSPNLPDVPYYQLDLNFGKRTADLNLRDPADRAKFEKLLEDVDVIIDGYRPGALDRLGYGVKSLTERFKNREKGFVYVAENCFGHTGPWAERSGWQPIADAVSGLAWGHGEALGLDQPVLPPFPMSDYGTGELGAIAALNALYARATKGGSYFAGVSLTRYNLWVMSLGRYPEPLWKKMLKDHEPEIKEFGLNHLSNFDVVSKAAVNSMKRLSPRLFEDRIMFERRAEAFGGVVKSCRPVVRCSQIRSGWMGTTRPNGYDTPEWI